MISVYLKRAWLIITSVGAGVVAILYWFNNQDAQATLQNLNMRLKRRKHDITVLDEQYANINTTEKTSELKQSQLLEQRKALEAEANAVQAHINTLSHNSLVDELRKRGF